MISFEVNGRKYQARDLDIFDQMVIAKRLMPVLKNIVTPEVLGAAMGAKVGDEAPKVDASKMLGAMADAIYSLSDEDTKAIMQLTLRVVDVQNTGAAGAGGVYSPLMAPNGGLLFKDIKLPDLLQVSWKVVEGHLGDFFSTAP